MTLTEMSLCYARTAARLQRRIQSLRAQEPEDPEAAFHLPRRISELTPLLREARALVTFATDEEVLLAAEAYLNGKS